MLQLTSLHKIVSKPASDDVMSYCHILKVRNFAYSAFTVLGEIQISWAKPSKL
jgi:hypothetical protein